MVALICDRSSIFWLVSYAASSLAALELNRESTASGHDALLHSPARSVDSVGAAAACAQKTLESAWQGCRTSTLGCRLGKHHCCAAGERGGQAPDRVDHGERSRLQGQVDRRRVCRPQGRRRHALRLRLRAARGGARAEGLLQRPVARRGADESSPRHRRDVHVPAGRAASRARAAPRRSRSATSTRAPRAKTSFRRRRACCSRRCV